MGYQLSIYYHQLNFIEPGGTSRGIMYTRPVWYLKLWDTASPTCYGLGECAPLFGLSQESESDLLSLMQEVCRDPKRYLDNLSLLEAVPSLRFALEMASIDLRQGGKERWFESPFLDECQPIPINGLIWMGDAQTMTKRIGEKLDQGFTCLKLKVGAIDFEEECSLLRKIRQAFTPEQLELRLDANGGFALSEVDEQLKRLAEYSIHSIEQPIATNQWEHMRALCDSSPIPIALDEELIGCHGEVKRMGLLEIIRPQYIILKPSLLGGFASTAEWINVAQKLMIDWWVTSALESNVGLNALAQWCGAMEVDIPQGLGTGGVFKDNVHSSLALRGDLLTYDKQNAMLAQAQRRVELEQMKRIYG